MYGITETTVHVTYRPLNRADTGDAVGSMIGRPLPDLQVRVLDKDLRPVPAGEVGELYVGGAGLARGYLDRPELNRTRFIPDPFAPGEARLYRTGDLARMTADGDMEYVGRADDQVKIRGFRIEPGEVEAVLGKHPGVSEAVVVVREDRKDEKQLVAFFTASGNTAPSVPELRQFLTGKLPAYMLPSRYFRLQQLPLTPSGKVDRKLLRAGTFEYRRDQEYAAPRTATETTLAGIWSEMLSLDRVGRNDNFFELGGHSLLVLQFISRVRETFGIYIPLKVVFDQPILEDVARWIDTSGLPATADAARTIRKAPPIDRLPLSFPQENIYFIQRLFPACRAYHGRSLVHFKGDLDLRLLEQSLAAMIQRHEIYRTTFHEDGGQTYQVVHPAWEPVLECVDLSSLPPEERNPELVHRIGLDLQTDFDLARLPLVRWSLYRTAEAEYTLLFLEHHLIHDGWSFNVFLRDWIETYRSKLNGIEPVLPELPIRFSDFAYSQHAWIQGGEAKEKIAFWKETLADVPSVLDLPGDHPRPAVESFVGSNMRIPLPALLLASLKKLSQEESSTLFMIMLAAFYILLYQYTGQDDLVVGSGAANRNTKEIENLVGMFINTIVLRARLSPASTFREFLRRVREITLDAYEHQEVPFDKVVEAVNPDRSLSRNALFQVMFNFNDAPLPEFQLPGASIWLEEGIDNGSAKVDLNVIVIPRSEQLVGTGSAGAEETVMVWEYSTALFDRARIARMIDHYLMLLQNIVTAPDRQLADLSRLDESERPSSANPVQQPFLTGQSAQPPRAAAFSNQTPPHLEPPAAAQTPASGKVDRWVLAGMKVEEHSRHYVPPKDRIESALIGIWQRVMGVDRIGMSDNFFELGGHSLMATALFAEIEKEFGCTLPLAVLFEEGTVTALANLIKSASGTQQRSLVFPIQMDKNKQPIFLAPGGGAEVVYLLDLAKHLGEHYSVYGFKSLLIENERLLPIPEVAARYFREIRTIQPEGPYYLLGHSAGGMIVFEIAHQLREAGAQVGLVGLLDTFAPGTRIKATWRERLFIHLQNFMSAGAARERMAYLLSRLQRLFVRKIRNTFLADFALRKGLIPRDRMTQSALNQFNYNPPYFDGCLIIFRVKDRPWYVRIDPLAGWKEYARQVDFIEIPGDHMSQLNEPHVQELVKRLQAHLNGANQTG
jgi:thioesterase domain-containing protein/acyl carrier protein